MARKRKVSVTMAIDFGGSGTKAIIKMPGKKPISSFMEPFVSEVDVSSVREIANSHLGSALPENLAWVGVGLEYRAVGYLAQSQFSANPSLKRPKYELALYKTLAAIWVAKERGNLPNNFTLSLAVLLPPGEYNDVEMFEPKLMEALAEFETPTGTMNVELSNFECFPEGGGIYMVHDLKSNGELQRTVSAIVMVGYRNASVLVSRRGVVDKGHTSDLGMVRLASMVVKRTSGLTAEQLAPAIAAAGDDPKIKHFYKLARSSDRSDREVEVQRIIDALAKSRAEYAIVLTSWLREVLPGSNELDEVVICGGTADYLRKELNEFFPGTPVVWHGGITVPKHIDTVGLGNRLADVYGLFAYLIRGEVDRDAEFSFQESSLEDSEIAEEVVSTHG